MIRTRTTRPRSSPARTLSLPAALGILLIAHLAHSAPVVATSIRLVVEPREITVADSFQIAVIIESPGGQPSTPELLGENHAFQIVAGPHFSRRIINRYETITYTYHARPLRAGILEIPGARVQVGQKVLETTGSATLTVTALQKEEYFWLEVEADRTEVYPEQGFTVTLRIYARQLRDPSLKDVPPFSPPLAIGRRYLAKTWPQLTIPWFDGHEELESRDFSQWVQTLSPTTEQGKGFPVNNLANRRFFENDLILFPFERERERLDPEHAPEADYFVYTLRKHFRAITPGRFVLGPVTARGIVLDDREGRSPQARRVTAQSDALEITVLEVPREGRPGGYTGAIGSDFRLEARALPEKVWVGSPMTLKLEISGDGKLDELAPIRIDQEEALEGKFRIHELPQTGELSDDGLRKTFTYGIRPIQAGIEAIPPLSFHYFDPEKEEFVTVRSEAVPIQVEKGEEIRVTTYDPGTQQRRHRPVDRPIYPVIIGPEALDPVSSRWSLKRLGRLLFVGFPIAFVILYLTVRRREQDSADPDLRRARQASRTARTALVGAREQFEKSPQEGFSAVGRALTGFVADRLRLPAAGMTSTEALAALREGGVSEETQESVREILETCEAASYGAPAGDIRPAELVDRASRLLENLQRELKGR